LISLMDFFVYLCASFVFFVTCLIRSVFG